MPIILQQIAKMVKGDLKGDPQCVIEGVGPLEQAGEGQITFAEKGPALKHIEGTSASAVLVPKGFDCSFLNLIQVDNPRVAFAKMLDHFNPSTPLAQGVHTSAIIGEHGTIGQDVAVGAGVVIGDHVNLGDRVVLHPNVVIGNKAKIGNDTIIYPNTTILERSCIGCRVIIHSGSVIGSDGFGFVFDEGRHCKIPQIGFVQIDDDVEIGANNTIDRGTLGKTWIKTGVKTDNLIHIAHNVVIGEHTLIVAQVGIAGSTTIGSHVILAGKAGISGHINIGDQVTIGPQCGVTKSIPGKQVVSGTTLAMPHSKWLRLQNVLPELPDLRKKVLKLEKQLNQFMSDK